MRFWSAILLTVVMDPILCSAEALKPAAALDRYVAGLLKSPPGCSDLVFAVQIDASLPALKKHGSMTGFKRIVHPGRVVYHGLRFTGDNLVKTQVIGRFLGRESNPMEQAGDISITPVNYIFKFDRVSDYNGLTAYVFLLKPRRTRAGLLRGELWLDANTAAPVRVWGDLVKSPSIFVRSLRFVQDYQTVGTCAEPLRMMVTTRTRIAGTAEITVWLRPAPAEWEATTGPMDIFPDSKIADKRANETDDR